MSVMDEIVHKTKQLIRFISEPSFRFTVLRNNGYYEKLSDEEFLKKAYKARFGKELDLSNPKTFTEKLQWLKLHDRNPLYPRLVDKIDVKDYVSELIGSEYVIPHYGLWKSFDEIDFDRLPNSFVLKCTHDSGSVIVCKDKSKFDISAAKSKLNTCLNYNYFVLGREWPYKDLKPQILAEKYIIDNASTELRDYKLFCFHGKVKFYKIDFDRFINHRANYYDLNHNLLKFGETVCPPDFNYTIPSPANIKLMVKLAELLSKDIPFARIDFYDANGKVYFGEITFYPGSGFVQYIPDEWDKKIGDLLKIN